MKRKKKRKLLYYYKQICSYKLFLPQSLNQISVMHVTIATMHILHTILPVKDSLNWLHMLTGNILKSQINSCLHKQALLIIFMNNVSAPYTKTSGANQKRIAEDNLSVDTKSNSGERERIEVMGYLWILVKDKNCDFCLFLDFPIDFLAISLCQSVPI